MKIFDDSTLPPDAMARILPAIRRFVIAHATGGTISPARVPLDIGGADLRLTLGADARHFGFRAYHTRDTPQDDQLVAAWAQESGALIGLATGRRLGALRTGAIGGLAADAMAPPGPVDLAVIGCGTQASTQIEALRLLRPIARCRVFGPTGARSDAFAARYGATACDSAQEAVRGASVVVLATDSPAQVAAQPAHMLRGTDLRTPLLDLGALLARPIPRPEGRQSLFLSAGLAGTEVAALAALCAMP